MFSSEPKFNPKIKYDQFRPSLSRNILKIVISDLPIEVNMCDILKKNKWTCFLDLIEC